MEVSILPIVPAVTRIMTVTSLMKWLHLFAATVAISQINLSPQESAWAATIRHPEIFDTLIAISGLYRLNHFIGDYVDENVYFNSPLMYLENLTDPEYLELYRQSRIIVCAGQGAWEDEMLEDTLTLKRILEQKNIPHLIDIWGGDVNHDWPWWRKMLPYFLEKLDLPAYSPKP